MSVPFLKWLELIRHSLLDHKVLLIIRVYAMWFFRKRILAILLVEYIVRPLLLKCPKHNKMSMGCPSQLMTTIAFYFVFKTTAEAHSCAYLNMMYLMQF